MMQVINKAAVKKTLAHTWYIYPIAGVLLTFIWMWAFQSFHQPSAHQKLNIFFATEVRNKKFIDNIQNKYDKEKLRQVDYSYSLPSVTGYYDKLRIAISNADIFVLTEEALKGFENYADQYFLAFNENLKSTYLVSSTDYLQIKEKDYGVLLKEKNQDSWLKSYMSFDESQNYYIAISIASKNIGAALDSNNTYYDNALTFAKHLLKENA